MFIFASTTNRQSSALACSSKRGHQNALFNRPPLRLARGSMKPIRKKLNPRPSALSSASRVLPLLSFSLTVLVRWILLTTWIITSFVSSNASFLTPCHASNNGAPSFVSPLTEAEKARLKTAHDSLFLAKPGTEAIPYDGAG